MFCEALLAFILGQTVHTHWGEKAGVNFYGPDYSPGRSLALPKRFGETRLSTFGSQFHQLIQKVLPVDQLG